jgi:hypothetical protein
VNEASGGVAVEGDTSAQNLPRLYEEIRNWVLDPLAEPWRASRHHGWGVLLRRGMAAWMESRLSPVGPAPYAELTTCSAPVPVTSSIHAELAVMLASIVVGHRQGARI